LLREGSLPSLATLSPSLPEEARVATTEKAVMELGHPTDVATTKPARSNSLISTSMRAIIKPLPRELIDGSCRRTPPSPHATPVEGRRTR
jgi:hypothetical protein